MYLFDFQDSHFTEQWWHMIQYVDIPKYGVCVYTVKSIYLIIKGPQGVTGRYWTYTHTDNMHKNRHKRKSVVMEGK